MICGGLLELNFTFLYQFFHFEYGILDGVASVRKIAFFDLFVNPSYELWQNADGKFDFDHFNPAKAI
jgi:hypothetical protein